MISCVVFRILSFLEHKLSKASDPSMMSRNYAMRFRVRRFRSLGWVKPQCPDVRCVLEYHYFFRSDQLRPQTPAAPPAALHARDARRHEANWRKLSAPTAAQDLALTKGGEAVNLPFPFRGAVGFTTGVSRTAAAVEHPGRRGSITAADAARCSCGTPRRVSRRR